VDNLLALGIPTYKRPDFAIQSIQNALSSGIHDQIIVASNSYEQSLIDYINTLEGNKVTFHQQDKNVGLAKNYAKIIELCECKYLHFISDEDYINEKNARDLYRLLLDGPDISLVIASVNDMEGNIYKDASWQKNKILRDVLGETAHIGSSIINLGIWTDETFEKLYSFCEQKGSFMIGPMISLLSYEIGRTLVYFPPHVVEMGRGSKEGEISGYKIYGFIPILDQYLSILSLFYKIDLPNKYIVYLYILYYFTHHRLQDAVMKFSENPIKTTFDYISDNGIKGRQRRSLYVVLLGYYYFVFYYGSKRLAGKLLGRFLGRTT
jgi:hypothetical protein